MRTFLIAGLMVWMIAGTVREAAACSCVVPPPPRQALEEADAVFAGEVISIRNGRSNDYLSGLRVKLRVRRGFKGTFEDTIEVRTADNSAACGFPFKRGEAYIVYAHEWEGQLRAGLCSRTALLRHADADLDAFDSLDLLDADATGSNGSLCGGPTPVATLQGVLFILLGLAWQRRRPSA